jgi:hypothetical protein
VSGWSREAIDARTNWSELEKKRQECATRLTWLLFHIQAASGALDPRQVISVAEHARVGLGLDRLVDVDAWGHA